MNQRKPDQTFFTKLLLAGLLAAAVSTPAQAAPFTEDEITTAFKPLYYGIGNLYKEEPAALRPQGCVKFEMRIIRDGTATSFRRIEGEFANHALLKKIQHFVLWRFSAARDHLEEPQLAPYTLCFNGDAGVAGKPAENAVPAKPLPQAADLMDAERNGVTNKAWLEQLMQAEQEAPAVPVPDTKPPRPLQPPLPKP